MKACILLSMLTIVLTGARLDARSSDPPVIICKQELTIWLPSTNLAVVNAVALVDTVYDDLTTSGNLSLAIRKAGTGSGFPLSETGEPQDYVVYDCCEIGTFNVEVWVRDEDGNTAFCPTSVLILDNAGNCSCKAYLEGKVTLENNINFPKGRVYLKSSSTSHPPSVIYDYTLPFYGFQIPFGASVTVGVDSVSTDSFPLNGVSTYDLVLISKHILAVDTLDSPYKMIAADANRSGSITSFDIVELRKLLLGYYDSLPNNRSWRFLPKSFVFSNPANPFEALFPSSLYFNVLSENQYNKDFIAIKIGDVNNTAIVDGLTASGAEVRSAKNATLILEDQLLESGKTYSIPLRFTHSDRIGGFQFGLQVNMALVEFLGAHSGIDGFDATNYRLGETGILQCSWSAGHGVSGNCTMWITVRALSTCPVSSIFSALSGLKPEVYTMDGQISTLGLRIEGRAAHQRSLSARAWADKSAMAFNIYSSDATEATIFLFRADGVVFFEQSVFLNQGNNTVSVHSVSPSGLTFWKIQSKTGTASGKLPGEK